MKHKLTLLMLCLFSILSLEAQTNRALVTGKVIDNTTKTPVEQAAIRVLSLPDSSFVTGVSSKKDGSFAIASLTKGRYVMKISFIGYAPLTKSFQITSAKPSVNFGDVPMKPNAVMLKGATVTAEAPPVTVKEDTMVYNASAYRVPEGSMLEDLVKKIPGAEVGTDGSITVNGKQIKKIMVDGKEFFSSDPKVAMKNLPVNMIENVKAYDKKSDLARITGIDDGDEETVLDLTVKKGMKKGLIGNLIAGTGSQNRYETGAMASQFKDNSQFTVVGSANNTNNQGFSEFGDAGQGMSGNAGSGINASKSIGMNFAKSTDKLEVGGNIKYGKSDKDARMKSSTENFLGQSSSFGTAENASRRFRDDVNGDFRLEWRPDTLTNIIFRPNISYSHTNSFSNGVSATFNNSHASVNDRKSKSDGISNNMSLGGNIQINRKLNNKGRSITLRAESGYNKSNSDNYSYSDTYFYKNDSASLGDHRDQYIDNNGNSYNYKLQMVYVEPVFNKRFLQLRYSFQNSYSASDKYAYNAMDDYPYETAFDNKNYNSDYVDLLSNSLSNRYMTHQFELSLRTIRTKYMYNIGFSLEPQTSKSNTTVGPNKGKDISQNVLNFSPTFDFHYRFSKQEQLRIMYRGRSSAPDINNLQAVIDNTDLLNIRNGNPDLKPSYSNRFMLFFNNYMQESQRSVMMNLSFNNTLNSVASKRTYNENTGAWISNLVNVNGNWNTQGFLSFNTPFPNKKFTLSTFSNASYSDAVSFTSLNNVSNPQKSTTHNLNLGQRMTGNYRSDLFDFSLNGAINYSLAKNNVQKSNRETFNYLFGANTNINLPWSIFLSSDVNYNIKRGYSDALQKNEILWNAQLSKNFLAKNNATIRFKIYDILHQQSNLSRTVTETMMQDIEYNTLGSYFMVHFVYRFNTLGGKAPRSRRFGPDDHGPGDGPRERRGGYGGGGFGPGGGPGGMM